MKSIRWACHAPSSRVSEDVGGDHGRLDVLVAEQVLDRLNVVTGHQEMGCEAVPEGVAADLLRDSGCSSGCVDGLANDSRNPGIIAL